MGRHLSTEKKKTLPELTRRVPIIEVQTGVDLERLYKQGIPIELPPKIKVKTLFVDKVVCS